EAENVVGLLLVVGTQHVGIRIDVVEASQLAIFKHTQVDAIDPSRVFDQPSLVDDQDSLPVQSQDRDWENPFWHFGDRNVASEKTVADRPIEDPKPWRFPRAKGNVRLRPFS